MKRIGLSTLAVAAVAGCQYYDSSLLVGSRPSADAGDDATGLDAMPESDAGAEAAHCASARPPGPPQVQDAGGDIEAVMALRTLDFHESGDGKSIGFDIDRTCTCEGDEGSCRAPADSTPDEQCDGPDGRDNNAAGLIASAAMLGLTSASLNEQIAQGEWSLLIRVQQYNGLPDDDQVTVSWLVPANLMKAPLWDGTDTWAVQGSCLNHDAQGSPQIDAPLVIDKEAYVTSGRLVASLRGGARLQVASLFSFVASDAYLVANLVQGGDGWSLADGVVVGVWRSQDILAALGGVMVAGMHLCTDHPVYTSVKQTICRRRDIMAGIAMPSVPCDSVSIAFTFDASPAKLGVALDLPGEPAPCPAATDPANDACD